jgi:serine/threonine protein kinase
LPINKPSATRGDWLTNRYVVNDYIVLSEIGKGAHAEVRLCKHKITNEIFAAKIMNRKLLRAKFVDVKKEVAIMKTLMHPNSECANIKRCVLPTSTLI